MKLELKQKKLFAGERTFLLRDNVTISVTNKSLKRNEEFSIDVVALDPKIRGKFSLALKSLITLVIFLTINFAFWLTPLLDNILSSVSLAHTKSWVLSATSIAALCSLIIFLVLTRYERVFVTRHTKVPIVKFYYGLPNKKEFKKFLQAIQKQGELRSKSLGLSLQNQRAGELKTLRRVYESGAISADEYDVAKNKLLSSSDT